jgi:hypothetical protein
MGETNDFSRQRLANFLAARLKARRVENNDARPTGPDPTPALPTRLEENPSQGQHEDDSPFRNH